MDGFVLFVLFCFDPCDLSASKWTQNGLKMNSYRLTWTHNGLIMDSNEDSISWDKVSGEDKKASDRWRRRVGGAGLS